MESIGVHVTYHISISFSKNRFFLEIRFIKVKLPQYNTSIIYSLNISFICMVRNIGPSQKKTAIPFTTNIINLYLLEGKQLIHSRILFDFHWLDVYIFFTYLNRCNNKKTKRLLTSKSFAHPKVILIRTSYVHTQVLINLLTI